MAVCEAERGMLSKLAYKVTNIVRRDYRFVDLLKTVLNFAVAFENE